MKKFCYHIFGYILLALLILITLDSIYTSIYLNSIVRNKVQFVLNAPSKHYNVVILGSSRAENHLVPEMFKQKGINAYNLGMSGSNLFDDSLLLKLFLEKKNTTDKIILQLDTNFESEYSSQFVKPLFFPYLSTNRTVYNHYLNESSNPNLLVHSIFPFYKYMMFSSKIGFRELFLTFIRDPNSYNKNGFLPLTGKLQSKEKFILTEYLNTKNRYFEEIKATCKKNKIQLIIFESPFCKYTENKNYFKKIKKLVPEIYDYSEVIKQDSLFESCGHMNKSGAKIFTSFFINKHFATSKK